ncbi:uroporphyrinogen-III synthase, partial [Escherichia coli]|nr:uroporphyrinogen-III synthase [Escherichia coli]
MNRPLSGKQILVTRARAQAEAFSEKIMEAGGTPIEVPLLQVQKRITKENEKTFHKLHRFTWVFFTSANGVKFFFKL